jgi:hypothetical protein
MAHANWKTYPPGGVQVCSVAEGRSPYFFNILLSSGSYFQLSNEEIRGEQSADGV